MHRLTTSDVRHDNPQSTSIEDAGDEERVFTGRSDNRGDAGVQGGHTQLARGITVYDLVTRRTWWISRVGESG